MLEGKDGYKCHEYLNLFDPCHFFIDDFVHLDLIVVPIGLLCFIYSTKKEITTIFLYNQCQYRWHMVCLTLLLLTISSKDFICLCCKKSSNHIHLLTRTKDSFFHVCYIF